MEKEVRRVQDMTDNLHIDIEDGNFVPNITFGIKFLRQLRSITKLPFSIHLMVSNPCSYIPQLKELFCSHIFVHVEQQIYLRYAINLIKSQGIKAGIALNPISNINSYQYLLDDIDAVLYMTSEPDLQGECFNSEILKKIQSYPEQKIEVWIDGGISRKELKILQQYAVDYAVIGRDLFRQPNIETYLNSIQEEILL